MKLPAAALQAVSCLALLALSGCAQRGLHDFEPGPHAVDVSETVLHDDIGNRDVAFRVVSPREPGAYPVVVFSHGAFCYPQQYGRVIDHWVSHGYVVVEPNHVDSPNNRQRMTSEQVGTLLQSRVRDIAFTADAIPRIAAATGIAARPDTTRMAIAGHSFGGMLAQIEAGLLLKDPDTGAAVSQADPRFRAAVIMSGVGPMPQMAADAFSGISRPLIASGGTLDEGNVGTGQTFPWEWRLSPFTLAPPGDKYAVILEKADHYLGGLICREERGGEDDPDGVAIVRALQTTFLDAYLKGDATAKRFLETADVGVLTKQRARFERK